jgi:hypothetical protein
MQTHGRTDGQTDIRKIIIPIHNFANAPKIVLKYRHIGLGCELNVLYRFLSLSTKVHRERNQSVREKLGVQNTVLESILRTTRPIVTAPITYPTWKSLESNLVPRV